MISQIGMANEGGAKLENVESQIGRAPIRRTWRVFAIGNHSPSCVLKSVGDEKRRPGRNDVSKY